MIMQFFNHGTGKSKSAINYLLQDNDSNGKPRDPKPEIFFGDPELTGLLIDNNTKKFKYTSGVIAFRDEEKPTDAQLRKIIKSIYDTFAPGLGLNRLNMLVVRHEDKGNTELHLLIPMIDAKTMKQFNIDPPGKHATQLVKDFSALWNHKLGYAQVSEDPLRAEFTAYDKKVPAGKSSKTIKERISIEIPKLIRKGKIKDRDDLIKFFEDRGCKITRKGVESISIKFPNQQKAIKLKGPLFSKSSDYKELVQQADKILKSTFLNDFQVSNISNRLQESVNYRKNFIEGRYNKPKRIPKGSNAYSGKIKIPSKNIPEVKPSTFKPSNDFSSENISKNIDDNFLTKLRNSNSKSNESQNATNSPADRKNNSGAVQGIAKSLTSLQAQINSAHADLANAQTLEERIQAETKLFKLMAQRNRLLAELEQARIAELNQEQAPTRRPKP
ncbi:relaxase/mobilization nuclease domain-containing protein [uncultured Thiothrix sp.]|uniref:relaxase/mobilization nuclease domain-containing protein n=1 Tax=uncultured Thiothrix sp. TaxID=223185 RepID=UPI00262D9E04|nr:relaxase/mobilization nuclease domain-containing protein [uncultured Thiothrix sp.]